MRKTSEYKTSVHKTGFCILKMCSFLPAILMLCVIFLFSGQKGKASSSVSQGVSLKIVKIGNGLLGSPFSERQEKEAADQIEAVVRKLAHVTEYFLLAAAFLLPLSLYGMKGRRLATAVLVLCLLSAVGDEIHQSFVSERNASVWDVWIDEIGAGMAVLLYREISRQKKRRNEKKEKENQAEDKKNKE